LKNIRVFASISVSKSDVDSVCKYILNQQGNHKKKNFAEKYASFIKYYQQSLQKIR
jgi:hypothetical protein